MSVMLATMGTRRRTPPARVRVTPAGTGHLPVMLPELLAALDPRPGEVVLDATLGAGGTAEAFLQRVLPGGRVLAFDRDPAAVRRARERFAAHQGAFEAIVGRFSEAAEVLEGRGLRPDVVVMDLGISSLQLDDPRRGFSFQQEGPLDMRMDPAANSPTAADLVAAMSEEELADALFRLAGEVHSRRIARAVVQRRQQGRITTTTELAEICRAAYPRRGRPLRIHPATKTFLALRIAVNDELAEIEKGITSLVQLLRPGGRIGVISFHSSEDYLAKRSLHVLAQNCVCPPQRPVCTCAHRATLSLLNRKVMKPSAAEVLLNPRARSARFRAGLRLPDPSP